jgi:anti-anti-sigma regulatory factor
MGRIERIQAPREFEGATRQEAIAERVRAAAAGGATAIMLDLSDLAATDTAMVATLSRLQRALWREGVVLLLADPPEALRPFFESLRADELFFVRRGDRPEPDEAPPAPTLGSIVCQAVEIREMCTMYGHLAATRPARVSMSGTTAERLGGGSGDRTRDFLAEHGLELTIEGEMAEGSFRIW